MERLMSDEQGFLDIVAEFDTFQGPKEIGAGEYTVLFSKWSVDKAVVQDVEKGVGKATFEILVGQREGDQFADQFWFPRNNEGANQDQRRMLLLAGCIAGRLIKTLTEANEILKAASGSATMLVSIDASSSRKHPGQTFYNVNYKSTVDAAN
jgi:hypothetical protein